MSKKIRILGAVIFLLLGASSLVFYLIQDTKPMYSEQILEKASDQFKANLKGFLVNVDGNIRKLQSDFSQWNSSEIDESQLNNYLTNTINQTTSAFGSVIFRDDLNYIIFREESSWVVTFDTLFSDDITYWYRFDKDMKEISSWSDTYKYFVDEEGIFDIKNTLQEDQITWRFIGRKRLERNDLIFCVFPLQNKEGILYAAALAFNLSKLEQPFRPLLQFVNPCVNIISESADLSVPVRPTDSVLNAQVEILNPSIENMIGLWKEAKSKEARTFSFEQDQLTYWTRVDTISERCSVNAYALTLSNKDLEYANELKQEVFLYLAILFGIIALGFLVMLKKPKKTEKVLEPQPIRGLEKDEILALIQAGETEYVEFKSSLRWDFCEEKVNKVLEDVIMKSIAAFSNAKGGTLFIGVTDDLEIIGLASDIKTLRKQDIDYFELHLRKLINNQYGISFANNHLNVQFPVFDELCICVIQINPADEPLYLSTKNKQGQAVEKFYVRSGNASQELTLLKEITDYVKKRFSNT